MCLLPKALDHDLWRINRKLVMEFAAEILRHCQEVEVPFPLTSLLDGCPAHYNRNVRQHLDEKLSNCVIGRESPFPWPARSPDLTCIDFYLWGRLQDLVFQDKPTTRENMMGIIKNVIRTLP
ncbi:hypothetical protein HUJ04_010649 [Dendroctonus ponderosae]|nr:hypothetical protein HUJ04_010649 [Dendroctonus ponderosae]